MKYEDLKQLLSKELLLELYPNNSDAMICEQFDIHKKYQLLKLLEEYNIVPHTKQENTELTCMHKYGVKSIASLDSTKNKIKQTNINKYGVSTFLSTKESQEKAKAAIQEKYGVDNVFQLDSIKAKSRETKCIKYGNPNFVNPQKTKLTKLDRYKNADYVNIEKRKNTLIAKYGVSHQMRSCEVQTKLKQTMQDRYGVDYYCITDECRQHLVHKKDSKPNQKFSKLLDISDIKYEREFKCSNYFYDFRIEDILIEINPTATHNSTWGLYDKQPLDKKYHSNKTKVAVENNFRCINVWDWDDTNKIINLLIPQEKIYARKCTVQSVDKGTAESFIDKYHLQGNAKASIYIGLFNNDELVSIMTFGKPRYNKKYEYELVRYCSSKQVIGGAEKIFSYFIKQYAPQSIVSYCDLSKFTGKTYLKLGFNLKNISISKHWYNPKTKVHITDNLLRQRGFDQLFKTNYGKGTSNEDLMLENGFVEIYDAGQATYIFYIN